MTSPDNTSRENIEAPEQGASLTSEQNEPEAIYDIKSNAQRFLFEAVEPISGGLLFSHAYRKIVDSGALDSADYLPEAREESWNQFVGLYFGVEQVSSAEDESDLRRAETFLETETQQTGRLDARNIRTLVSIKVHEFLKVKEGKRLEQAVNELYESEGLNNEKQDIMGKLEDFKVNFKRAFLSWAGDFYERANV